MSFSDDLYRVIAALFAEGSADMMEQHFVEAIRTMYSADAVWFAEVSDDSDSLRVVAHSGLKDAWTSRRWRLEVGQGIGGGVSLTGVPAVTRDYGSDARRAAGVTQSLVLGEGLVSALVLPVVEGGELPCSVLYVASRTIAEYGEGSAELGSRCASLLALARRSFVERYHETQGLAASVRGHEDITDKLLRLSRLTPVSHSPASLADTVGRMRAVLGGSLNVTDGCGATLVGAPGRLDGDQEWPVESDGVLLGSVSGKGMIVTSDARLQEAVLNLIGALLLKRRSECEMLLREANTVSELLVAGSRGTTILGKAERLWGPDDNARMVILVGGIEAAESGLEIDRCLELMNGFRSAFGSCVLTGYDKAVAAFAIEGLATLASAGKVREVLRDVGIPGSAAAIGTTFLKWEDYGAAYRAALRALNGVVHSKGEFDVHLSTAEPGGLPLLAQVAQAEGSREAIHVQLAPLLRLGERGRELIETLNVYFVSDMNLRRSADVMHVHVNTLRGRLKRIEDELDVDLANGTERFHLELLVRIYVAYGRPEFGRTK